MTDQKVNIRKSEDRKESYWAILNEIIDPDVGYGIVDLGLIYDIKVEDKIATVFMTFTSPACPSAPQLVEQVEEAMMNLPDIDEAYVEIIWEPQWDKDKIDEDIRYMLFGED